MQLNSSVTQSRFSKGECHIKASLKLDLPQQIAKSGGSLPARAIAAIQECIPAFLPDSDSLRVEIGSSILAKSLGFNPRTITITTPVIVQPVSMEKATDSDPISFTSEDEAAIADLVTALRIDLPNDVYKRLRTRPAQIDQTRSQVLSASA